MERIRDIWNTNIMVRVGDWARHRSDPTYGALVFLAWLFTPFLWIATGLAMVMVVCIGVTPFAMMPLWVPLTTPMWGRFLAALFTVLVMQSLWILGLFHVYHKLCDQLERWFPDPFKEDDEEESLDHMDVMGKG